MTTAPRLLTLVLLIGFAAVAYVVVRARAEAGKGMPHFSAYSSGHEGLATAASVLSKLGWQPVAVTRPIQQTHHRGLLILVDPHTSAGLLGMQPGLSETDVRGLLAWVASGNTLLLCGRQQTELHDVLGVGFSAARAHHVVAIDRCPILAKSLDGALNVAWAIAESLDFTRKPLDIQFTATDQGLDVDIRGSGTLTASTMAALARAAQRYNLARLTRHGELIAQTRAPTVRMGTVTVPLPPGAFLQATAQGEAVLSDLVVESCTGASRVVDLFAGVGPFALRLAAHARVSAFDQDEAAIAALKRGVAGTAGLKPVEAEQRDLFKAPLSAAELNGFDAVVFDPPRLGAQAQSREIAASRVPIVVAVSCSPGTFARDIRHLLDGGYGLLSVTPVDQFRYSAHVEIVARLQK